MFDHQLRPQTWLQPLEPWHATELAAHLDRARDHIRPWVGRSFVTTDLEGAEATLRRYAQAAATDTGRLVGIWADDTLVGGVMFTRFDAASRSAELGCWLEPAAEGRGLVTQSCRVLLEWAFERRGIHRVEWHCRAANTRSRAVARRLGMTHEGTLREAWVLDDGFDDTEVWAVLATDVVL